MKRIMTITNISFSNLPHSFEINTEAITGDANFLNNQMIRLQFNLQRENYRITNAGYGFLIGVNYKQKRATFAKILGYVGEHKIPLSKNNKTLTSY